MENVLQKFASGMGIVLAEYIERDALLDDISAAVKHRGMGEIIGKTLMRYVKRQPAADVAPVVHGRWEWFDEETGTPFTGYEREWGWKCSYCGEELPDDYDDPDNRPTFRFCHSCGAKMDGGVE